MKEVVISEKKKWKNRNLSYNQLTGTIPTNIANMGILVTL